MAEFEVARLFEARSFAVVGASDKPGPGLGSSKGIAMSADPVRVYYVNPNREELFGQKCYDRLSQLPEVVDCVAIATSAKLVNQYLEEAGRLGIRSAVVYASGFREDGTPEGRALEDTSREICTQYGITVCGPNCMGFINNVEQVSGYGALPVFPEQPIARGIGVVAQSGFINSYFMRNYPQYVAYAASVGNGCTCSLEDYLLYYAQNEHVSCIAAYMEGIRDARKLEVALRIAAEARKPVVVLKSGRSERGARAAASHTGNLAGNYAAFESVFRRFGVIGTNSLEEFSVTAKMFAILDGRLPKGTGIGAVNFSGGENTLCADYADRYGLELPALTSETEAAIRMLIPPYSSASNPLDPTTTMFTQEEKVGKLFQALAADPGIQIITLGDDLSEQSEPKDITCANVFKKLTQDPNFPPAFVIPSFEKTRNKELKAAFENAGITVLSTGELGYAELSSLCSFKKYDPSAHTLKLSPPEGLAKGERVSLSEAQSKELIADVGLPMPKQERVADVEALKQVLNEFTFPIVMKIDSADIAHKTEAGGVKLGIADEAEAEKAFFAIMESCRAWKPDAVLDGVLVQEMAKPGLEVILGIVNDPQLGPMLMVGLGGVFTEVFQDVAMCPCPMHKGEALELIDRLKGAKLMYGYRGQRELDVDALAEGMVKLSAFAAEQKDSIAEMDLNPVVVYEKGMGIMALDALIIRYES